MLSFDEERADLAILLFFVNERGNLTSRVSRVKLSIAYRDLQRTPNIWSNQNDILEPPWLSFHLFSF